MSDMGDAGNRVGGDRLAYRRARVRGEWLNVRAEIVDRGDASSPPARGGGTSTVRAWVRLGRLAPVDVVVELMTPSSSGGWRMWCEQSYRNGSFAYAARLLPTETADPDALAVRVTPASQWTGPVDLPPVVGSPAVGPLDAGRAAVTSGSGPARARAGRTPCGA
jgi:hypothetical protein